MSGTRASSRFRKRPSERSGRDRVDVREAGQVADDRADRAAAAAARRERVARRAAAAHLARDLARELEHLPVEQEEAGEAELVDQRQLLVEPGARLRACAVGRVGSGRRTPGRRRGAAARSRARRRRRSPGSGSRAPREVELEPLGELGRARDGVAVVREALGHLVGRRAGRSRGCRAARARSPRARCGCGSRRARPGAARAAVVRVDVAGDDRLRRRASRRGRAARALRRASPRSYGRWSSTKNRSRPKTRASSAAAFGSRTASPSRAQPERQTSPSLQLREQVPVERGRDRLRRLRPRVPRAPRSAAGRGSRTRAASRRAA